eukprot:TRINITY_DN57842_c0_g1_i1.p1 TRINITY_DN57842_c0_g1~~TRINITY_DN57842_c0_g1_i1.p1  ORF type:complete len:384 (-),score=63.88 TRINITY_DN57842_c0_g1_i1:115-1266(-)
MTYPLPPRRRLRFTDFQIGMDLGEGSLSTVRLGTEVSTQKQFAIKMFDRNYLRSQRKDADVEIEEHCLRRLNHPGIAKLYASFSDEAWRVLVLELCPGRELWEMAKGVGLSDRVARHYLAQVVEAVSYLRDARVVHRDLKAENVMIGDTGTAKLVDFGTAKDFANPHVKGAGTRSFKTVLEDNVGTPNFMAPEVVKNKFSDFRSDTWSLGCMVYQVVSGQPPFGVDLLRIYKRALKARLWMAPGISDDAQDLVKHMVRLDPNARLGCSDIRDIRDHKFFGSHFSRDVCGPRFEGSHRQSAPVRSLGESCLRALGRTWATLGVRAVALVTEKPDRLPAAACATIARFQEVAERAAAHARQGDDEAAKVALASSSEDEGNSAGPK